MSSLPRSAENTSSCPRSTFSLQPETNLFGKLRAVQNGTTHSLRAFNCWGQADTHSHTLAHTLSHKMAALTKISSPPKAAYELNYHLCSAQSQSPPAHLACASDTVWRSCVDVINGMNLIVYKFHLASRQGLNNKQSPWLVLAAPTNNSHFTVRVPPKTCNIRL